MKAKLKMSIIISVMCLVALCSIVAIIAIFAANTQTFNSNVSVSFKAPGVLGKVSANYYVGSQDTSGTPMTTTGTSSGEKELVFNDTAATSNGTLNPQGDIQLTSTNRFVVFEYIFQNGLGNTVSTDYMAILSLTTNSAINIKMTTKQSKEKVIDFNRIVKGMESSTGEEKAVMVLEHNEEDDYISTRYFYVKVEVNSIGKDASFSGNFGWELNLTKPTLDKLTFTLFDDYYAVSFNRSIKSTRAVDPVDPVVVEGDVIIPSTFIGEDGVKRPVTFIYDNGFAECEINGRIYIPDSITRIGGWTFSRFKVKKGELTIPESVTSIDKLAFQECESLKSIQIGENLNLDGYNLFLACYDLTEVVIDSQTVCENLISRENKSSTKSYLIDYATTIKAKYEISGIADYTTRKFTRSKSQDSAGYWIYTYIA